MKPMVMGNIEVQSDRACAVYDAKTGRIHHVHRVITLKGGAEPTPREIEARARELAGKAGTVAKRWETLMVDPEKLQVRARHKVDVKTRSLVSKPISDKIERATKKRG